MNTQILDLPGDLFLGSTAATALEQGARRFRTVARAVCFAMEQAAPVSLRGAMLKVGDSVFGPAQIRALHRLLATQSARASRTARTGRTRRSATGPSVAAQATRSLAPALQA